MRRQQFPRPVVYRIEDLSEPRELAPATTLRDRVYSALTIMARPIHTSTGRIGRVSVGYERVRFLSGQFGVTSHQIRKAVEGLAMRGDITYLGAEAREAVES